jgi:oligoendopeptidase F
MLKNGQIDVYPKQGKRGGAFMSDAINVPTKVLLNHADDFKSLETLAHEMGHAIHAHRSKSQPALYQGFSIIAAETASTLFENLLFDAVYAQASEANKVVLLHDRLTRDISTIQRQIAFFNFELEMHLTVRTQGGITHAQLQLMLQKHLQSYLGDAVEVTKEDGNSYVYIGHFRYGFYVYSYAFGILMSTLMAQHYAKDKNYIEKIDAFLCAGKSDTVEQIFASIGIETNKKSTFLNALKTQEKQIKQFEELVAKRVQ